MTAVSILKYKISVMNAFAGSVILGEVKMQINEILKIALNNNDANRPRSLQKEVGASSVYSCSRQVWAHINQLPRTNFNTDKLTAMFGTAMHEMISQAMAANDPFNDYLIEEEFTAGILKGHIDLFIKSQKQVVDWKTVSKAKIKSGVWLDPQKIGQVQLYGYLLEENGYEVEYVSLVAIPRDGTMADIVSHTEPYDRDKALAGIDWLTNIAKMEEPPAPEKGVWWCSRYCNFYDATGEVGCQSK